MSRFLPERPIEDRVIREERLQIRSIIARDAPRNAPVTLRGQAKVGRMTAEMIDSNTGAEFNGEMFEGLQKMLGRTDSMESAARSLLDFTETQVSVPLATLREKYRCDAIVKARIVRRGDGDFYEVVDYDNPAGTRFSVPSGTVAAPAGWHDTGYDLYQDIVGLRDRIKEDEGLEISAIITTQRMLSLMNRNDYTQLYGAGATVEAGKITKVDVTRQGQALFGALAYHDLPAVRGENFFTYDGRYDVEVPGGTSSLVASTERFIPNNVFIMLCQTGRDAEIDLGDDVEPFPLFDTLGYTGIGKVLGENRPGVKVQDFLEERHPPHIDFEGVQCCLPVILDAKYIYVITIPDPTP